MSGGHETPTSAAAIAADREAFRVFLREHNLPATAQRLAIADVVLGTDRHLSADDVARELRAHGARAGTATVYDFSTGAGVNKFGFGRQTTSWTGVNAIASPVATAHTAANYLAMATSNATGGVTDANRYITPALTAGSESTHLYRFVLAEPVAEIDEIKVLWEGYADACTQVELYVWNNALGNWGDANGLTGQNRSLDNFAGNRDERLEASIRSNIGNFVAADGSIRFLVYGERQNDETFHDFMSVTVLRAANACPGDLDGSGTVDGSDLAQVLVLWGNPQPPLPDLSGDGVFGGDDLAIVLANWGV